MNIDDLRKHYSSYILNRDLRETGECNFREKMILFFEPRVKSRKKIKIADHITNCPACARDFLFLNDLHRHQQDFINYVTEHAPKNLQAHRRSRPMKSFCFQRQYVAVPLGIITTIVAAFFILRNPNYRIENRSAHNTIHVIRPVRLFSTIDPIVFDWQKLQGADYYKLEVFDEALLPVWKSNNIGAPPYVFNKGVDYIFRTNIPYYWLVSGYSGTNKLAESDLTRFVIKEK